MFNTIITFQQSQYLIKSQPISRTVMFMLTNESIYLTYALIARQDCKFPKGTKGKALKEEDIKSLYVGSID